jgi:hypothetical protein
VYTPTQQERTLAMLCHIGGLVGGFVPPANIIVPLVIWLIKKDQSAFINDHGKEAINFQITVSIAAVISFILILVLIGIALLALLGVAVLVLGIVAGIKAYEGNHYRYPFTLRLVK